MNKNPTYANFFLEFSAVTAAFVRTRFDTVMKS